MLQLTKPRADDLFARMPLVVDKRTNAVLTDKDGQEGWIEFWADDAKACRDALKRHAARLGVYFERREKRKGDPTPAEVEKEFDELTQIGASALAHRVKAWRLVDYRGEFADVPVTHETAMDLFLDKNSDLRELAQAFVQDRDNFKGPTNAG